MTSLSEEELRRLAMDALTGFGPEIDPESLDREGNLRHQLELDSAGHTDFALSLKRAAQICGPEQGDPRLSWLSDCLPSLAGRRDRPTH
ncbi:hypothetical protein [Thiorhodococcus minor]|uniref:Uncharacterized protein n=1 Tax=Thiorhodococcus minor TaxID=57489 RepID=A0A6M0JTE1_9GAMM|nr:hypothetical protein [Thiorhodococcus minor]NEV60796.1 hypothetical protein [Thiorhodococcus minor]